LVLKDRDKAKAEHIQDRLNQVKDNWAFLVEEHTTSKRQGLYRRLYADITDLLRVIPTIRSAANTGATSPMAARAGRRSSSPSPRTTRRYGRSGSWRT